VSLLTLLSRGSKGRQLAREPSLQLHLWDALAPAAAPGIRATPAAPSAAALAKSQELSAVSQADLGEVFARVFRRLRLRGETPLFQASFHPFAGLRSTIRVKSANTVQVRVADLLAEARPLVIEALAEILLTRLYHSRTSREACDCYQAWAHSPGVLRRIDEVRRDRGRKLLLPPRGRRFDLKEIFADLNRRFFASEIDGIRIGWSPNRSRTLLGHYDSSHRTITITRWLDSPGVPRYVVEYLVFHEMLHVRIPVEHRNHRRVVHSAEFMAAERAFPDYARAARWLRIGRRRRAGEAAWEGM
jgi:hypothetical protein